MPMKMPSEDFPYAIVACECLVFDAFAEPVDVQCDMAKMECAVYELLDMACNHSKPEFVRIDILRRFYGLPPYRETQEIEEIASHYKMTTRRAIQKYNEGLNLFRLQRCSIVEDFIDQKYKAKDYREQICLMDRLDEKQALYLAQKSAKLSDLLRSDLMGGVITPKVQ